jgi:hypothetical protein
MRREELPQMETNEHAQRERYREVESTVVKLVEEIEGVERKREAKRVGECGHEQHLVDYRTKQILTMMGQVAFKRAYYHCQGEKEQQGEQGDQK